MSFVWLNVCKCLIHRLPPSSHEYPFGQQWVLNSNDFVSFLFSNKRVLLYLNNNWLCRMDNNQMNRISFHNMSFHRHIHSYLDFTFNLKKELLINSNQDRLWSLYLRTNLRILKMIYSQNRKSMKTKRFNLMNRTKEFVSMELLVCLEQVSSNLNLNFAFNWKRKRKDRTSSDWNGRYFCKPRNWNLWDTSPLFHVADLSMWTTMSMITFHLHF